MVRWTWQGSIFGEQITVFLPPTKELLGQSRTAIALFAAAVAAPDELLGTGGAEQAVAIAKR